MTTTLIEELVPGAPPPSIEEVEAAKKELTERYSREDLERLKGLSELLRTPMNRKQRRAVQSRMKKFR